MINKFCFAFAVLLLAGNGAINAQIIEFDFLGNGGSGLLPGNENPGITSSAFGDETGAGITYDTATNVLSVLFDFQQLTGGLLDAAGGIHIHDAGAVDPLNSNGGIEFLLNEDSGSGRPVAIGSTSGTIDIDLTLSDAQEIELLNSQYYVNIHSGGFNSGELRGNLVQSVPEPGSAGLLAFVVLTVVGNRRRRC